MTHGPEHDLDDIDITVELAGDADSTDGTDFHGNEKKKPSSKKGLQDAFGNPADDFGNATPSARGNNDGTDSDGDDGTDAP